MAVCCCTKFVYDLRTKRILKITVSFFFSSSGGRVRANEGKFSETIDTPLKFIVFDLDRYRAFVCRLSRISIATELLLLLLLRLLPVVRQSCCSRAKIRSPKRKKQRDWHRTELLSLSHFGCVMLNCCSCSFPPCFHSYIRERVCIKR